MTTPQQPDKELVKNWESFDEWLKNVGYSPGQRDTIMAETWNRFIKPLSEKPQPVSENKGDGIKKAAIELRSALHDVALDLDELPVIENIIRKFFVTREEHERVKGLVEKAYLEGGCVGAEPWEYSEVKKGLEG